ncbi:MAG TPA: type II toxin-antitoxin system RelE/ParE family toxin [Chloroflexota bacterium]|nr:type II toxin-antitoxin system RelE/ParE family toxin [Chloroflexota bacterium]
MAYRVQFARRAERQFKALPRQVQVRLRARIEALTDDPRPAVAAKLAGPEELYRIRVGDYRVVYAVQDAVLLVLVVGVGHRRDVYRRLFS